MMNYITQTRYKQENTVFYNFPNLNQDLMKTLECPIEILYQSAWITILMDNMNPVFFYKTIKRRNVPIKVKAIKFENEISKMRAFKHHSSYFNQILNKYNIKLNSYAAKELIKKFDTVLDNSNFIKTDALGNKL